MSKRKYESFTDEQARKVLRRCGGNHRSEDPKGDLDRLVRNPPDTWSRWRYKALIRGIGGWRGYKLRWWVDLVDAISEGYLEIPTDKPFDRARCIKEVRAVVPCCSDVTRIIFQYLLPVRYAPGVIFHVDNVLWSSQDLVVQYYTRGGKICVESRDSRRRFYLTPWRDGFVYKGMHCYAAK